MALEARVTDNLNKEIDTVRVIHARDNDPAETTILSPAGHDLYKGSMTFPGLELGQTIRYRIQVADSAIVPNVATSPDTGWHAFHIVRGFGRDFEANDGGLHAEELWEWGSPEPLLHAYSGVDVWGTNLSGAYPNDSDASLIIGPVDLSNFTTAGLYFRNFYDTEPFYDSGAIAESYAAARPLVWEETDETNEPIPLCRHHVDVRNSRFRRPRAIDRGRRVICLPHERANAGAGSC